MRKVYKNMSELNQDLLASIRGLKNHSKSERTFETICKPPFSWAGGKTRARNKIMEHLPFNTSYVEPFGGCGIILLSRESSPIEVFNDRHSGIVDFYKCLRDSKLLKNLIDYFETLTYSREDFNICKDTWENAEDPVERAAKWYWSVYTSFSSLGRNFGRPTTTAIGSNFIKLENKFKLFWDIHNRIRNVIIENQDWRDIVISFDSPNTVFYLDPPYLDVYGGTYKYEMTESEHESMLDTIFTLDGFVAVSSYSNSLYDSREWSSVHSWDSFVSTKSMSTVGNNNKTHLSNIEKRGYGEEYLYIKDYK